MMALAREGLSFLLRERELTFGLLYFLLAGI
jgi:hypothetical protein